VWEVALISGIYNFTIEQGATFSRTIVVKNPDNTLYNLTGYTARMQIRRDIAATEVMISLTTENGKLALGGANGQISITLSAADTATITRNGVYDLELVTGATVYRLLRGAVSLVPEVTR
jgi:molybdopterin-binding protein